MGIIARARSGFFQVSLLILPLLAGNLRFVYADEAGPAPERKAAAEAGSGTLQAAETNGQDFLRSYLQIQEQLHNTQLAIEKNRLDAEAAASNNAVNLDNRLALMERALATQRLDEMTSRANTTQLVLWAAGIFAAVGFLVLLLALFLQWSAANRLAAVKAGLTGGPGTARGGLEHSFTRFSDLMERLQQRVQILEASAETGTASLPLPLPEGESAETRTLPAPDSLPAAPSVAAHSTQDKAGAVNDLIGKVQKLLQLDKAEAALGCLEEVLALDPGNTDALIKKGTALERLQRFEEALTCYDCAIARDNSMTMAYLYKGGVFNRMERYNEALECYEQALKTRQKGQAANVIMV
jgi:tetratricopeptide (TPR) repeat protein